MGEGHSWHADVVPVLKHPQTSQEALAPGGALMLMSECFGAMPEIVPGLESSAAPLPS